LGGCRIAFRFGALQAGKTSPESAKIGSYWLPAPIQFSAQRGGRRRPLRGLQAHHVPGPAGQRLLCKADQELLRGRRVHL
jgi:hypothetical protein